MTDRPTQWRTAILGCLAICLVAASLGAVPSGVGAQDNESLPGYYDGHRTQDLNNDSWTEGNEEADADSITTYASRLGTFVVGSDGASSGPVLTGMLLLGSLLSMTVGARVGMVGGGVLAVIGLWGIVSVGLAPQWLLPVAMFGVGLLLASGARRALR